MTKNLRIGSFNVQNLFQRAKALSYKDHDKVDELLKQIGIFQALITKSEYTEADKKEIVRLYLDLSDYITVRENRGKLFSKQGWKITGVKAAGYMNGWDGEIGFKPVSFEDVSRENTARVIREIGAGILCIVEAENRKTMRAFDSDLLKSRYRYELLIDGNDNRDIDVGLYSEYPVGRIRTHIFDRDGRSTIFSRDCLEVEVTLSDRQPLYILCNHFKSKGYDPEGTSDKKRKRQAEAVAKILESYDLEKDWVVVAGDFNDTPDSAPLRPLLEVPHLHDVLRLQFPADSMKRWTYYYEKFEQIDFILVSEPLKDRFSRAGVERRGIAYLGKKTTDSNGLVPVEKEFPGVTKWENAASDHGAVWAEFRV